MINQKAKQSIQEIKIKNKPAIKAINTKDNPIKLKINTHIETVKKQTIKTKQTHNDIQVSQQKKDLSPKNPPVIKILKQAQKTIGSTPKNNHYKRLSDLPDNKQKPSIKIDNKDLTKKENLSDKKLIVVNIHEKKSCNTPKANFFIGKNKNTLNSKFNLQNELSPNKPSLPSSTNSMNNNYLTTTCTDRVKDVNSLKTNSIDFDYVASNENMKTILVNLNTITPESIKNNENKTIQFNYLNNCNDQIIIKDENEDEFYPMENQKNIEKILDLFKFLEISNNEHVIVKTLSDENRISIRKLQKKILKGEYYSKTEENEKQIQENNKNPLAQSCPNKFKINKIKSIHDIHDEESLNVEKNYDEIYNQSDFRVKKYHMLLNFMKSNLEEIKELIKTEDNSFKNNKDLTPTILLKKSDSSNEINLSNKKLSEKSKIFSSCSLLKSTPKQVKFDSDISLSKLNINFTNNLSRSVENLTSKESDKCDDSNIDEFQEDVNEKPIIDLKSEFLEASNNYDNIISNDIEFNLSIDTIRKVEEFSKIYDFLDFFNFENTKNFEKEGDLNVSLHFEKNGLNENDVTQKIDGFPENNNKNKQQKFNFPRKIEFHNKFRNGSEDMENIIKSETMPKNILNNNEEKKDSKCSVF